MAALFRQGDDWAVFAVNDGRARATVVEIGHRNERMAELYRSARFAEVASLPGFSTATSRCSPKPRTGQPDLYVSTAEQTGSFRLRAVVFFVASKLLESFLLPSNAIGFASLVKDAPPAAVAP